MTYHLANAWNSFKQTWLWKLWGAELVLLPTILVLYILYALNSEPIVLSTVAVFTAIYARQSLDGANNKTLPRYVRIAAVVGILVSVANLIFILVKLGAI